MSKTEEFKKLETWLAEREKQNHELLAENTVLKEKLADFTKRVGMGVTRWSEVMDLNKKMFDLIMDIEPSVLPTDHRDRRREVLNTVEAAMYRITK